MGWNSSVLGGSVPESAAHIAGIGASVVVSLHLLHAERYGTIIVCVTEHKLSRRPCEPGGEPVGREPDRSTQVAGEGPHGGVGIDVPLGDAQGLGDVGGSEQPIGCPVP